MRLNPQTTGRDELAWEAFRYVADAMTPREAIAFERKMLDDQSAREAVAAAVDSVGAMMIVAREVAAVHPSSYSWTSAGLIASRGNSHQRTRAAVAASLALAASLLAVSWKASPTLRPGSVDHAIELVRTWMDLRGESVANEAVATAAEPTGLEPAPGAEPSTVDATLHEVAEIPAERPLPSWILAAVATPASAEDPESDSDFDTDTDNQETESN